jgi:prepilin-type N-terminal cleavage/methylation domain-containing protein
MNRRRAFTLIEVLVVAAILGVLAALLAPAATRGLAASRAAACRSNLRQMQLAFDQYLDDHAGRFFPWREARPEGTLWYWGLEKGGGGARAIDRSQARLAPYLGQGTVETCPAFPYQSSQYKQKFETKTYGYGLNIYLLSDTPEGRASGVRSIAQVSRPASTLAWGDAIQVNMFQAPASPSHPMLEEWYYLAARNGELPTYHFRHSTRLNAVALDGSVRSYAPDRLLAYCDGRVGYLEPNSANNLLMTSK